MKRNFEPDRLFRTTLHQILKRHLGRNRGELTSILTEKILELCEAHFAKSERNAPLLSHSFEIFPHPLMLTNTRPDPVLINNAGRTFFDIKELSNEPLQFSEIFEEPVASEIIIRCINATKTKTRQIFSFIHNYQAVQATIEPLPSGNLIHFQKVTKKDSQIDEITGSEILTDSNTNDLQQLTNNLIEINKKNNALLEAIPDLIFVFDRETRFIDVKTPSVDTLLLPPEHFIGKKAEEVLPPYLAEINKQALEKVFTSGGTQTYSYSLNVQGKERFFDTRMVLVDYSRAMAIVRDITDKVLAEQELKEKSHFINALLEAIPIPVFFKDKEGRYIGCNPAFTEFTGLELSKIQGKTLGEVFNDDPFSQVYYQKDKELLQNETFQQYEFKVRKRDGTVCPVIFAKNVFRDRFGEIAGIIGVFVDISEQKSIQEELLKAKEKAEESERIKTAFLNNISHEIRTPMNSILGFADLLRETKPDEAKSRQYLDVIEASSRRMLQTITNIVGMARIHSGEIEANYGLTSLNTIVTHIETQFKSECQTKGIDFRIHYQNLDKNEKFLSDESKVIEILSILVDNAIKFTHKGFIEIVCSLKEGKLLQITVHHTGIGIAPSHQQIIFNAFEKVPHSGFTPEGMGLGLSIAKALAEILDGKLTVESQPEEGSTFTLTLPYRPISKTPYSNIKKIDNANILIVEDDPFSIQFFKELLKQHEYKVYSAPDGLTAINLLRQMPEINLVLLDIKLPDMDGYTVAETLRTIKPDLIIIAQTAYASPDEQKKALNSGVNDFLTKPVEINNLLSIIEKFISKT
ncbi:MAG TPA: PAS domain-containing protein [Salinivirgaceae bacterium]|nr:PAS domain-containing protein [Salinivirgaceae bacterium]